MDKPVSSIRNLGPASDAAFARAGLKTAQSVIDLGADGAYARLLASGSRPHFIAFYALAMGLQGRPWNDCQGEEKADLRQRFDRLVAENAARAADGETAQTAIDAALDAIGVRES